MVTRSECAVVEHHAIIRFLLLEELKPYEIQRNTEKTVLRKGTSTTGWKGYKVDDGSCCPTTSRTADSVERVNDLVQEDSRIIVADTADTVGHQVWIFILHHPREPLVSQNLWKVVAKAASE